MATLLTNYDEIKAEVKNLYEELLTTSSINSFLIKTSAELQHSLEALDLGDDEKAQFLLSFHSDNTKLTLTQTFDQAMKIIDLGLKLPKEVDILGAELSLKNQQKEASVAEVAIAQAQSAADLTIKGKQASELDAKIDLIEEQTNEVKESVSDRQQKRIPEVNILNKQSSLIDEQINKLKKDIAYVEAQKGAMEEQVEDNKLIKAMDSLSDMIATLGNGGLVPNTKMFETFFKMNKTLTGEELPGDYSVTKK